MQVNIPIDESGSVYEGADEMPEYADVINIVEEVMSLNLYVKIIWKGMRGTMFCRNCGKEIADGDKFCGFCGFEMEETTTETVVSENDSARNIIDHRIKNTNVAVERKKRIIKWLIVAGIILITFFWFVSGGGTDSYIEMVQDSVLNGYDYGVCIGDALHEWFAGTEEWDCYEEDGDTFVIATGSCPYALTNGNEEQRFYFKIMDDEHFRFLSAYTGDGSKICSSSGNSVADELAYSFIDWISPLYEIDLYEEALRAAFGDEEAMDIFRSVNE